MRTPWSLWGSTLDDAPPSQDWWVGTSMPTRWSGAPHPPTSEATAPCCGRRGTVSFYSIEAVPAPSWGPGGESIIDLTWATPAAAAKIRGWHMDAGSLGELTDHRLIRMELVSSPAEVSRRRRRQETERRWALRKMDPERLEVNLLSST